MPRFVAAILLSSVAFVHAQAQSSELETGKFLIASRNLGDPNFAEAVVLLLHYDEDQGAMGLIINRASDVPLSRVLQELKEAKGRSDTAYMGGPVEPENVLALLRTPDPPEDAQRVFSSVHLITTKELLEKALSGKPEPANFHVYLGYAGWGPGQLEHEISLGAWKILQPDAGSVFDADPDSVWPRLIRRTETRIARVPARVATQARLLTHRLEH